MTAASARVGAVRGGLPGVALEHPAGGRVEIALHGGHVLSWTRPDGDDVLFLSRRAVLDESAAIRGGVPVIFPQFGAGPLPKHGFARTARWSLAALHTDDDVAVATLELRDDEGTRAVWPHRFVLALEVSLDERLTMRLRVTNRGADPFALTAALHTYFRVGDVEGTRLLGLRGVRYIDKMRDGAVAEEDAGALAIASQTDRVYLDPPRPLRLDDSAGGRVVEIAQEGFRDTVVWNPWSDGVAALPDMAADEWRSMLCVEAAAAGHPVHVAPGAMWSGAQILRPFFSA